MTKPEACARVGEDGSVTTVESFLRDPVDQETLNQEREQSVQTHGEPPGGMFTCDNCATAPHCTLAFDWYNTNDDCLLEK